MKSRKTFVYNTAVLTGADLAMRCVGLAFQAWLAGRIGSAGIGLFQLVMSVGGFAMTFAITAALAEGETEILGAECVNISYPDFYQDLNKLAQ